MNFTEYYELTEDLKWFDECLLLDENFLTTIPKFVGGAATNLVSQLARGTGNVIGGVSRTGVGAGQAGLGLLQGVGGGFKSGSKNINKGFKTALSGAGQTLTGATQALASPVSAVLRGAQAASEPISPQPFSKDRNLFQRTFGLNQWEKDKESEWSRLVKIYKLTSDQNERVKILKKLKELDPERYAQARRARIKAKREKETKKFLADLEKRNIKTA